MTKYLCLLQYWQSIRSSSEEFFSRTLINSGKSCLFSERIRLTPWCTISVYAWEWGYCFVPCLANVLCRLFRIRGVYHQLCVWEFTCLYIQQRPSRKIGGSLGTPAPMPFIHQELQSENQTIGGCGDNSSAYETTFYPGRLSWDIRTHSLTLQLPNWQFSILNESFTSTFRIAQKALSKLFFSTT